jgi:hypothetical protein
MTIFHVLQQGWPMTKFEHFKVLFEFSKVENCPHKHWQYAIGWTMAKTMYNITL